MAALPANRYTRCYGMRLAVVGSAHLQRGELEEGLKAGRRSMAVLTTVRSERAREHLRTYATHLARWKSHPAAQQFLHALAAA
jgi:hypothetical protein